LKKARYLRLEHELNGNWYSWSANATGYAAAWRYVWTKVMEGNGFTNTHLQWIFEPISPYDIDAAHDFRNYWPGILSLPPSPLFLSRLILFTSFFVEMFLNVC
jgi:hypothetical protein